MTYKIKYRDKEEMKDSGIEWIGKIPEDWEIGRIQNYFENRNEKVSDKDFEPLSVTKQGILKQLEHVAKTDNGSNRKKVLKGDFVINSRADRKKSCGVSPYDGSVSLICHVLKPKNHFENMYANYLFRNYYFSEEFFRWGTGIVDDLWSTNINRMNKINIPYPSIEEQYKIYNFLDYKTSQFDSIIEKKEKLIEKLEEAKKSLISEVVTGKVKIVDGKLVKRDESEMKDSGIEWLGKIPKDWEVVDFKRIIENIQDGTHGTHDRVNDGKLLLSAKNVHNNGIRINKNESLISEKEHLEIIKNGFPQKNDILFTCVGTIGRTYVYDLEYPISFQRSVAFLRLKKGYNPNFYKLYCEMKEYQSHLMSFSKASAQSGVYLGDIVITKTIKVPLIEQNSIYSYLNKIINKIEKTKELNRKQIKKIKQAKQSLISEAVTGKIDLRDWEIKGDLNEQR